MFVIPEIMLDNNQVVTYVCCLLIGTVLIIRESNNLYEYNGWFVVYNKSIMIEINSLHTNTLSTTCHIIIIIILRVRIKD